VRTPHGCSTVWGGRSSESPAPPAPRRSSTRGGDGPGPGSSSTGPSSAPANGGGVDNFLHSNTYPNTAARGQTRECEAGNEDFIRNRKVLSNLPGNQGTKTDGQVKGQK